MIIPPDDLAVLLEGLAEPPRWTSTHQGTGCDTCETLRGHLESSRAMVAMLRHEVDDVRRALHSAEREVTALRAKVGLL